MFGGAWLAWPWYVLNGKALGSPTFRKECIIATVGFAGALALAFLIMFLGEFLNTVGYPMKKTFPYLLLVLTMWKLGISYWLHVVQSRTFDIYTYYGGVARNGVFVVALAAFFGRKFVVNAVGDSLILIMVLT